MAERVLLLILGLLTLGDNIVAQYGSAIYSGYNGLTGSGLSDSGFEMAGTDTSSSGFTDSGLSDSGFGTAGTDIVGGTSDYVGTGSTTDGVGGYGGINGDTFSSGNYFPPRRGRRIRRRTCTRITINHGGICTATLCLVTCL